MSDTIKRSIKLEMEAKDAYLEYDTSDHSLYIHQEGNTKGVEMTQDLAEQLIFFLTRVHEEFINERA